MRKVFETSCAEMIYQFHCWNMATSEFVILTLWIVNLRIRTSAQSMKYELFENELLIRYPLPKSTTVDCQVGHETARTVLHEDTLMLVPSGGRQLKVDVDERHCLTDMPVDAGSEACGWDLGCVEDKVPDGSRNAYRKKSVLDSNSMRIEIDLKKLLTGQY